MKVLIGYDGSDSARAALGELKSAALPRDTEILVAAAENVWMPPAEMESLPAAALNSRRVAGTLAQMQAQAARAVETIKQVSKTAAEEIGANFPGWSVGAELIKGEAAFALMEKAAEWKADLIVVGSQNRSTVGRILLGSVSRKVVTEAACSVRIARESPVSPDIDTAQRVVFGIDNADTAGILSEAARRREWTPGSVAMLVGATSDNEFDEISPVKQIFNMQDILDRMRVELEDTGLKVLARIRQGDPKTILLEEAETLAAHCIFVGSRNIKGALNRFWLGSVSTAVVTNATCSVEVVRPRAV
jgi:nucleotide-binding universal stress UspA family protein